MWKNIAKLLACCCLWALFIPGLQAEECLNAEAADGMAMIQTKLSWEQGQHGAQRDGVDLKSGEVSLLRSHDQGKAGSYLKALWSGMDVVEDGPLLLSTGPAANRTAESFPEVHLLGPPHSGTNLMVKMLQLNWPDRVPSHAAPLDHIVWKHSLSSATDIQRLFAQQLDTSQITLIIQIRSPIAQMASWRESPYSLTPCIARETTAWTQPCFANTAPLHHDVTPGVDINVEDAESNHFSSSMDVYNQYLKQYLDLERLGGFKQVIWSPYEDVVLTPNLTFQRLAHLLGWPFPEGGIHVYGDTANANAGGVNAGRDYALEKLGTRAWLSSERDELPMFCQGIDLKQIGRFTEGTHSIDPPYPRPYPEDCAHV